MLVTDSFVMLNYPKTGSSFARKVIKDLYARQPKSWFRHRWCEELILPNIRTGGADDQHGCYSQIPSQYRNREVVSIVRNPFDRFLSIFEFRYWVHNPLIPWELVYQRFPMFPDLTLEDYCDFNYLVFREVRKSPVGHQTQQFLQIFGQTFPPLIPGPYNLQNVMRQLAPVTLLRQENLNSELREFLHGKGFDPGETAFIDTHTPVNVTIGRSTNRPQLWTAKAIDFVRTSESLMFDILAARGIYYEPQLATHEEVKVVSARVARARLAARCNLDCNTEPRPAEADENATAN